MHKKPLVLVVEDDPVLAQAMSIKFTSSGFRTIIAQDGDEALRELRRELPQVVILDILLPKKNGFDVLKEIKVDPIWKQIPVLIASNLESDKDIEKGYSLGAGDYIVKSNLSLEELVKKVIFLIDSSDIKGHSQKGS